MVIYGLTGKELSKDINVSLQEAVKFIRDWYKAFPQAKRFIDMKRNEPLKGIDCVTPFGRLRSFIINDKNLYHIQNEAINTPVQSIASDLTLFALLDIQDAIKSYGASVIVTVHDSIILEVKDDENLPIIISTSKSIMENTPRKYWKDVNLIPFVADVETGDLWGELKTYG